MNTATVGNTALVEPAPVFHGPMVEAMVIRSVLDAHGFTTHIEGEALKTLHPFLTGANALDVRLLASSEDMPGIAEVLPEMRSAHDPAEHRSTDLEKLEALGVRTRWACVASAIAVVAPVHMSSVSALILVCLLPIALTLGVKYLERARRVADRPRFHGVTVPVILAMFFVITPANLLFLYWFLAGLGRWGSGILGS